MVKSAINISFRALVHKCIFIPLAKTDRLMCDTCRYAVRPYRELTKTVPPDPLVRPYCVTYQTIRLCKEMIFTFLCQIVLKHGLGPGTVGKKKVGVRLVLKPKYLI